MTPSTVSRRVVLDRLALIDEMLDGIRALPLDNRAAFFEDRRNVWAAESCLRRSLEALFDIGRHILAKGYGVGTSEYEEVAVRLREQRVLPAEVAEIMRLLGGYRNRLVHFYHEISPDELFTVCATDLGDVEQVRDAYRQWVGEHAELLDDHL